MKGTRRGHTRHGIELDLRGSELWVEEMRSRLQAKGNEQIWIQDRGNAVSMLCQGSKHRMNCLVRGIAASAESTDNC